MPLPGRHANLGSYRYGFQNQETDPEMLGGTVAFTYRVHDPRIGRFLSIDPLAPNYPWNSPFAFSENRVIDGVELEGLEFYPFHLVVLELKLRIAAWSNEVKAGGAEYAKGLTGTADVNNPYVPASVQEQVNRQQVVHGATVLLNKSLSAAETSAEIVGSIPGVDIVADPVLATYYAYKGDVVASVSYTAAASVPFVSGAVVKTAGKYAIEFLTNANAIIKGVGVNKFFSRSVSSGFVNTKIQNSFKSAIATIENITANNLKDDEISGLIKDIHGYSSNGDHLNEALEAVNGLKNQIDTLTEMINNGQLTGEALSEAQRAVNYSQRVINYVNNVIKGAEESAKLHAN